MDSMSVLNKISYFQKRRDEVPNQELARELVETKNNKGIQEMVENLWNKNKSVRSDCLKVLYEIGYINPNLIAEYVDEFLKLLKDKENRMVWGAMIGLATIAEQRPREIWQHIDDVIEVIDQGTLITFVWGIKTLARVAATDKKYRQKLFPVLIGYLQKCFPRDLPLHAESVRCAVDQSNLAEFLAVLEARQVELKPSQLARLKKLIKEMQGK
jgi:hypothetical protein